MIRKIGGRWKFRCSQNSNGWLLSTYRNAKNNKRSMILGNSSIPSMHIWKLNELNRQTDALEDWKLK
jgi:hypothetical protein